MSNHNCIMEDKIDNIEKKVDQILTALKGNDMGTTGVIPRLNSVEKKVSILNLYKNKLTTTTSIISMIVASAVTFLIAWLTKILS